MPLNIKRSALISLNYPVQTTMPGGLSYGSNWSPYFAPDSWSNGAISLNSGSSQVVITNPVSGSWGIRIFKVFLSFWGALNSQQDGPLNLRGSDGTVIFGVGFGGVPQTIMLDFAPFGLNPINLTANIELINNGTNAVHGSYLILWGREAIAIQAE